MNVYKIELLLADEYSDPSTIVTELTSIITNLADESVFVQILSCKRQVIDIQDVLFKSFDESKAINVMVK